MAEIICIYKKEQYSVRDNGEVLRRSPVGKRPRPTDNNWTFGKANDINGYMEIASVPVHRIIATAFHGVAPSKEHVVDHIDTNKRNNRPENLRWVTRLENILLNTITARRIEIVCGSVEAFLADPSKFREAFSEPNYKWMCVVSSHEAQISLKRMLAWAKSDKMPSGGSLGEWIFNRSKSQNQKSETATEVSDTIMAKTFNAAQRNWKTSSEFPCCPQDFTESPLTSYSQKLSEGSVFCRNSLYSSIVSKSGISDDFQLLYVISECKDTIKPWGLAKITYENDLFVHMSLGTFFEQKGAEKQFCRELGLECNEEESIDDYC